MKRSISLVITLLLPLLAAAQAVDTTSVPAVLTLEDALRIALSENASVKVADMEIERTEYARKGSYSALLPQVNGTGSYQRTIKKQVMYMGGGSDDDGEGSGGGMAGMMAGMKLAMNETDHTIADLMTDGCNMGVKSLSRYLNQYAAADETSKDLAKRLVGLEEQLAKDLRSFL